MIFKPKERPAERAPAVGPTGRPLHSVGAVFEAAMRRLGARFGAYLLLTAACGLLPLAAGVALSAAGVTDLPQLALFTLAFSVGHYALVAVLAALVTDVPRRGVAGAVPAVLSAGVVQAGLVCLHPVLCVVAYVPLAFAVVATAVGDAPWPRSLVTGPVLAARWLGRWIVTVVGLGLCAAGLWFGFVISLSPLDPAVQQRVAFACACALLWPLAALVVRILYGDLTGRLVIRPAPPRPARRRVVRPPR